MNKENRKLVYYSVFIAAVFIGGASLYSGADNKNAATDVDREIAFEEAVLPSEGIEVPVYWGNVGARLVKEGAIDAEKFKALYKTRGGLGDYERELLLGSANGRLKINRENSGVVLNLLWAFGLANKNSILEEGPMADPQYGGAGVFASTGGWTLAKGSAMEHYSRHPFVALTPEQQRMVERVSQGIYRPCCGNSTYFPDCNHGMAMLGLLELMAAQGVSEEEMYRVALQVNSYWFPDTYLTIAKLLEKRGISWRNADAREILGVNYSSAQGFQRVLSEIEPVAPSGGGSCGA